MDKAKAQQIAQGIKNGLANHSDAKLFDLYNRVITAKIAQGDKEIKYGAKEGASLRDLIIDTLAFEQVAAALRSENKK